MSANLCESGSQSYHLTLLKELSVVTDLDLVKLSSCKDDLERFSVAYALPFVNKCRLAAVEKKYRPKSLTVARNARLRGNQAFQKKNFTEALKLYSAAAISAPRGDDGELEYALALANRSAALMSLENYDAAIEDIDEALSSGYPEDLHHKVLERQVKCLLQTNKPLEAVKICRLALEKSDVLQQKKIEASFKQLLSKAEAILSDNCIQDDMESGTDAEQRCPMVVGGSNPMLPSASNKISIEESMEAGRYVVAASNLEVGDVLVVEKAYASVMRPDKYDTHCHHCYSSLKVPVPCLMCSRILFCSRTCRQAALLQYHSAECFIIDFLASTGFGIVTSLALRILTIKPVEFYIEFKSLLEDANHLKCEDWSDEHKQYLRTYNLLTHTGIKPVESLFDSCVQAIILLKCLRLTGYFGTEITDHGLSLSDQELWIGSLLLRHIHILEVNGHEICEVEASTSPFVEPVGIGAALFLTTALFNHSCDPSVTRYFIGDTAVVRTIRPIGKGETVEDNYGPFFTKTIKEKRRKILKDRYFFLCMCTPCVENWPLYNQMTDLDLRFRCSEASCGKSLTFNQKMTLLDIALCPHCNAVNDMAKSLQHFNDAKSALDLATSLAGRGQYDKAIDLFRKSLLQFDNILHPPHKYYLECQEGIRKCFWMFGNVRPLATTTV